MSSLHQGLGLTPPCPGEAMASLGVQLLTSVFGFFQSNVVFHQKVEIFGAASEAPEGVTAGWSLAQKSPQVFPLLLSPQHHGVSWGWHQLWGSVGCREPPAPQTGSCVGKCSWGWENRR